MAGVTIREPKYVQEENWTITVPGEVKDVDERDLIRAKMLSLGFEITKDDEGTDYSYRKQITLFDRIYIIDVSDWEEFLPDTWDFENVRILVQREIHTADGEYLDTETVYLNDDHTLYYWLKLIGQWEEK